MGKASRLKKQRRQAQPQQSGDIVVVSAGDGDLTLLLDTGQGVAVRRIPQALPLPPDLSPGTGAEKATHAAAAIYGLPDFIFEPALRQVGAGVREMGDGTLLVDRDAVMIQVKNRPTVTEDIDKEERWIRSSIEAAVRQANGSVRQLRSGPARLTNARGRVIEISGDDLNWLVLVILDHPNPPPGMKVSAATVKAKYPTVVLLRRDWDFLFAQLKSSHAVVQYLKRVAANDSEPDLGHEAVRYYELAAADAAAPPSPADERFMGPNGVHVSAPLLPQAPVGQQDQRAHAVLRVMMEDIATSPMSPEVPEAVAGDLEAVRIELLSMIDHLPVAHREGLGSTVLEFLQDVRQAGPDDVRWRFRRILGGDDAPQLAFGAASRFSEQIHGSFRAWVMLRHVDFCRAAGTTDGTRTAGVLLTPRGDGLRPWDTTCFFIEGDLSLTPEEEAAMRKLWPDVT
ncbi:hypothetical protein [Pedococcus sp. 2YAF34]|uniref:hypothetical protein n=1 Tax=Pedococcus sp. 2YAF34 TaxID=3233032 RepID=UPI003F9AF547